MQASQTSILVVRRVLGTGGVRLGYASPGMSVYLKPEPPIEISLDGKWIGTIERAKMSQDLFSAMAEGPPKTEEVRFEIQAGHHDLTLDVSWFQGLLISYTIFGVAPLSSPLILLLGRQ